MTSLETSLDQSVDPELVALAEGVEAEFMYRYVSSAQAAVGTELGIATRRIGGGVALSMRNDPTGYWSKALGFGLTEPITDELVGRILDFYRSERNPQAVLQPAPSALPADWNRVAERHGLVPGSWIVKVACRTEEFALPVETRLRVEPVTAATALTWAGVIVATFGMPTGIGLESMLVATVDHPSFRPFAVWDGDTIVGGATLYLHDGTASLNSGAVAVGHRNQGAQSALIAARVEAAQEAGCEWVVAEAGKPGPGMSNPSLDNLLRGGLRPLYSRQDWLWRLDD